MVAAAGMRATSGIAPAREERQVASAGEYVGMSRSGVEHKLRIICCIRNGEKDMESTLKGTKQEVVHVTEYF